jgi:S1-C subfamily serine protease
MEIGSFKQAGSAMGIEFPKEMRRRLESAVSKTVQIEPVGSSYHGAGVVISKDGVILTAAHVIDGAKTAVVRRCHLKRSGWDIYCHGNLLCDILYEDKNLDIAILRMKEPPADLSVAKLGDSDLVAVNEPLWRVGRDDVPLAGGWIVNIAHEQGIPEFKIGMAAQPGSSGGPVFDAKGLLVAITLKYHPEKTQPEACYALPVNVIKKRVFMADALSLLHELEEAIRKNRR